MQQKALTLRQLMEVLRKLSPDMLEAPVRVVTKVREIEKGQNEGALVVTSKPALSLVLMAGSAGNAIFFFSEEKSEGEDTLFATVPLGTTTGNPEIDQRFETGSDENDGEGWKNG